MNYFSNYYQPAQMPSADERIWVQGEDAAKAYLVAPGGFVRLWDSTKTVFYEKKADLTGRPYMDTFTYTQIVPQEAQNEGFDSKSTTDLAKELNALKERIENLERGVEKDVIPESSSDDSAV